MLAHGDNKKKYILVFGENVTDGSNGTAITTEDEYSVKVTKTEKTIYGLARQATVCFFLYANCVEIYKFKSKTLK